MKICWLFSVAKCLTGLWNLAYTVKISHQMDKTIEITQEMQSWAVCWDGWTALLPLPPAAESREPLVRCPEPKGCCGRCRQLGSLWQQAQFSGSGLGEGAHSRKYGSSHSTTFFMMEGHYMPLVCKSQQKFRGDWEELIGILVSCIVSWSWYKVQVFDYHSEEW